MTEIPLRATYEIDFGDESLREGESAILTFGDRVRGQEHPEYGEGWRLFYREPYGTGIEEHFIPGRRDDLGWVRDRAESHLQQVYGAQVYGAQA